jgi:hypothetical protein
MAAGLRAHPLDSRIGAPVPMMAKFATIRGQAVDLLYRGRIDLYAFIRKRGNPPYVGWDCDGRPAAACYTRKGGHLRLLDVIKRRLGLDFSEQARREVKREEENAARKSAERYSRGSVGIQKGAFQTREDLDRDLAEAGIPPPPPRSH